MSRSFRPAVLLPAVGLAALALTGCSEVKQGFEDGKREAILETVGKTAVEQAAEVTLTSDLSCGVVEGANGTVSCSGTTSDGTPVALTGIITEAAEISRSDWVKGEFVATVGNRKLTLPTCLGNC